MRTLEGERLPRIHGFIDEEFSCLLDAVRNTCHIGRKDMVHNDWLPRLEVDAEAYEVRADGELLVCEPDKSLPMA